MDRRFSDEAIKTVMNKIYHYLVKIGANPEDAKDIVQDSFYKAILYIDTIQPDKISSWGRGYRNERKSA